MKALQPLIAGVALLIACNSKSSLVGTAAGPKAGDRPAAERLFDAGLAQLKELKLKAAIVLFEQAVEADPSFALPHRGLGIAHARDGNRDASIKRYSQYVRLDPEASDAVVVRQIIIDAD